MKIAFSAPLVISIRERAHTFRPLIQQLQKAPG